jgi:hypothetical protein
LRKTSKEWNAAVYAPRPEDSGGKLWIGAEEGT